MGFLTLLSDPMGNQQGPGGPLSLTSSIYLSLFIRAYYLKPSSPFLILYIVFSYTVALPLEPFIYYIIVSTYDLFYLPLTLPFTYTEGVEV